MGIIYLQSITIIIYISQDGEYTIEHSFLNPFNLHREDEILIKREELIYLGCKGIYGNSVNLAHTNTNRSTKYKIQIRATKSTKRRLLTLETTPNIIKKNITTNYQRIAEEPTQEHVGESVFKLTSTINNKPGKHIISLFIDGLAY